MEPQAYAADKARQLVAQAQQLTSEGLTKEVIVELIQTIVVYKFPHLSREEVEAMLGLSELKQTKVYQEALEEGLQQGKQEGEQSLILRLLTRRVGTVSPELQAQIQALPLEQLEALGEALLDFSALADLVNWLKEHLGAPSDRSL